MINYFIIGLILGILGVVIYNYKDLEMFESCYQEKGNKACYGTCNQKDVEILCNIIKNKVDQLKTLMSDINTLPYFIQHHPQGYLAYQVFILLNSLNNMLPTAKNVVCNVDNDKPIVDLNNHIKQLFGGNIDIDQVLRLILSKKNVNYCNCMFNEFMKTSELVKFFRQVSSCGCQPSLEECDKQCLN